MQSTHSGYSSPSRWLHWLTAILVLMLIPAGIVMTNLGDGPLKNTIYELHKSAGITVFALAVLRVLVRTFAGAPAPYDGLTPFQRIASQANHYALYVLIIAQPLTGWLATSMCCAPVNILWTVPVTLGVPGSEETAKALFFAHCIIGFTLAGLVAFHIGAALYHWLIRRDGVMTRMALFGA